MAGDKRNAATRNRQVRQEALREQLASQGHLQHVLEIAKKIEDEYIDLESTQLQALKTVIDTKLKLIDKYLPSLKAVELSDPEGNSPFPQVVDVRIVSPDRDT